jgi:hypothetical protein
MRICKGEDTVLSTNMRNELTNAKIKVRDWYSAIVFLPLGSSLAFIVFIYDVVVLSHRCCKTRVIGIHN